MYPEKTCSLNRDRTKPVCNMAACQGVKVFNAIQIILMSLSSSPFHSRSAAEMNTKFSCSICTRQNWAACLNYEYLLIPRWKFTYTVIKLSVWHASPFVFQRVQYWGDFWHISPKLIKPIFLGSQIWLDHLFQEPWTRGVQPHIPKIFQTKCHCFPLLSEQKFMTVPILLTLLWCIIFIQCTFASSHFFSNKSLSGETI